jgi:hypothetical protein
VSLAQPPPGPIPGRAQLAGDVGEDLEVVLVVKAKGECERHLIHFLESCVCVQLLGNFIAGADEVRGEHHAFRPLRGPCAGSAFIDVPLILLPL